MRLRSAFVPLFALAALSVRAADPTQTPDQLADALRAQLASAGRIEIRGLAVPAGGSGTAVLRRFYVPEIFRDSRFFTKPPFFRHSSPVSCILSEAKSF